MENISNEIEKRNSIRKLLELLKNNSETIKKYENIEYFRQNINSLYLCLKNDVYDSIEYDVPKDVEIRETDHHYYYKKQSDNKTQKISVIDKNLEKFYFLTITNDVNYQIIKYYKNENCQFNVSNANVKFNTIDEAEKCKSLILGI